MKTDWTVHPIGVVRSKVKTPGDAPKQGALEGTEAEIVVSTEYAEALVGLERRVLGNGEPAQKGGHGGPGGKIIVLCWMHEADRDRRKSVV